MLRLRFKGARTAGTFESKAMYPRTHHSHKRSLYTSSMKTADALTLAQKLVAQHGFGHLDVTISKSKRALGRCFFMLGKPVRIDLSSYWVNHLNEHEVRDTILHEIAHAIAGHEAGHGATWKAAARQVGANPNRLADIPKQVSQSFDQKHSNYVAVCKGCENKIYFDRAEELRKEWIDKLRNEAYIQVFQETA